MKRTFLLLLLALSLLSLAGVMVLKVHGQDAPPSKEIEVPAASPNASSFEPKKVESEPTIGDYVKDALESAKSTATSLWHNVKKWMSEGLQELGEKLMPSPQNKTR